MAIRVEFYGIARSRAGVSTLELEGLAPGAPLAEVLAEVARQCPDWGAACLWANQLRPEFTANLDGQRFVREPATPVPDGVSLLIMSADAGG